MDWVADSIISDEQWLHRQEHCLSHSSINSGAERLMRDPGSFHFFQLAIRAFPVCPVGHTQACHFMFQDGCRISRGHVDISEWGKNRKVRKVQSTGEQILTLYNAFPEVIAVTSFYVSLARINHMTTLSYWEG